MTSDADRPIFIVGMDRSGTTLLSAMLDAHPRIAMAPQTWFASDFGSDARLADFRRPGGLERLINYYTAHPYFPHLGLHPDALSRRMRELAPDTPALFFKHLFRSYAEHRDKPRWGEPTPHHYRHLDLLQSWFPHARILFLLRDPRAVNASFRRAPFGDAWTDRHARQWTEYANLMSERAAQDRAHIVRYESLITHPEAELRSLCAAIDEPFDPVMITREGLPHRTAPHEGWRLNHELRAVGPLDTARLDAWRDELSPYQIAVIEHYAGAMMERLGYARSEPPLSPAAFTRLHLGRARRNLRHGAHVISSAFGLGRGRSAA